MLFMCITCVHTFIHYTYTAPEKVTMLNVSFSSATCIMTITWMVRSHNLSCVISHEPAFLQPPPPSSRPPVTGYKMLQNTTGNVMFSHTNDTEFIYYEVDPGIYSFTVQAINIFGDGRETSVIISG